MRNQKVKELYKDMVISNEVNQFVKKGINKIRTIPLPKTRPEAKLNVKPTAAAAGPRASRQRLSLPHSNMAKMPDALPTEQIFVEHNKTCIEAGVLALPLIFTKIEHNQLKLQGYQLGNQSFAISEAISRNTNSHQNIRVLSLDGCCLKDDGFARILKSCIGRDCLESISYSNDEMGEQSLDQL